MTGKNMENRSPYQLNEVIMLDPYCVNAFLKDIAYLLSLDADRLLAGFRENAGLSPVKMRYGGWENMLIGGHTLGHYLTAIAQGYANAQIDPKDKEALKQRITYLLKELKLCQEHSKGKPGFLFGATILDATNVELQFDYVEQNKTNIITEAWVPWYTMHKILDGLVNVYALTGFEEALFIADRLGDWTYERVSSWSEDVHKIVLSIEYGGMNDALYELYSFTKKEEHLVAAHAFDEIPLFEVVANKTKNGLNNHHANTTIPKFLGALNRYLVLGEGQEKYLEYAKVFWDTVIEHHTYVTGGNSEWEHFGVDDILDAERTNCNNETCNTYNMLKLSRKLYFITGEKKYADYYENTLINAILSSQNPEDGMTMYFQPMASGYFKVYGRPFDKFWCCTGSGMENFTKLNDSIYVKTPNGIITNLYFSSKLMDQEKGICVEQKADLPKSDTVYFSVNGTKDQKITLSFRVPDWAANYEVYVGKEKQNLERKDGYLSLTRNFFGQTDIRLCFKMKVIAHGLSDSSQAYAFKYGPVLLSADLGTENRIESMTGVDVTIPEKPLMKTEYVMIQKGLRRDFVEQIDSHFSRDLSSLNFTLMDVDQKLIFHPHYQKTKERYGIYWYLLDETDDEKALKEERRCKHQKKAHLLDTVQPGYGQYENDALHAMVDDGSESSTKAGTTRRALAGGSFSYHMRVKQGVGHILEIKLLSEDEGEELQIQIGQQVLFTKTLKKVDENEEYSCYIPISKECIEQNLEIRNGQTTVLLTFSGSNTRKSARLSSFIYMYEEGFLHGNDN